MCRWFAYLSHEPALLEDVLVVPKHAITKQVHDHYLPGLVHHDPAEKHSEAKAAQKEAALRNIYFNIDGFGVAWYTNTRSEFESSVEGPRPALYKTVVPALTDPTFAFVCENTASTCIFAHIRAASAPPIVETNNHPFASGRHIFMHNGTVTNFAKIRRDLGHKISKENYARIQGNTDSEHLAALYFTHLGNTEQTHPVENMRDALASAIKDVQDIQAQTLTEEELAESANSLNLCATDGEQMIAVRWRNSPTQQPPSLYVSTTAGVSLNRKFPGSSNDIEPVNDATGQKGKEHGLHVIIASEPTTFQKQDWTLLGKNEVIVVDKAMNVRTEALKV